MQFQTLQVRSSRNRFQSRLDIVAQIEIHGFQINLSGLDFGEIQDVIDQGEQRVRRKLDRVHVFALLGIQTRFDASSGHRSMPLSGARNGFEFRAARIHGHGQVFGGRAAHPDQ